MGLLARVADDIARVNKRQAWPLGSAVLQMGDDTWGHAQDEFAPTEYGQYIATSNGVYACATLRARLLSSLPLLPYRLRPRKGKEAVAGGALLDLLDKVNPHWTLARLLQQTELSLCLWGSAYWFLERGSSGKQPPREIWWGRSDRTRPVIDRDKYIKGFLYSPDNTSEPIAFGADEVIWFRYPNPLDEFSGLSPLAAARLPADYASAAMKANRNLFQHGLHLGGMISPMEKGDGLSGMMTKEQANELEILLDKRFKGTDNAHRWMILTHPVNVQGLSISPKDADFLGGLKESLEQIARAYGVPQDIIGGSHTYENVDAAMRALWTQTMRPEAMFVASELTEQLLPMFPGQGDLLEFDFSEVEELKEEETEAWTRWKEQIATGAHTINEWRDDQGLESVPWGDVAWMPLGVKPVIDGEPEPPPPPPVIVSPAEEPKQLGPGEQAEEDADAEAEGQEAEPATESQKPRAVTPQRQVIAYGSEQHRALWNRFVGRTEKQEDSVATTAAELFRRQEASILARLNHRSARDVAELVDKPFDKARWTREFREAMRPRFRDVVAETGRYALTDMGFGIAFDVVNPLVTRFIERRTQKFAREVNDTTWQALKDMLDKSIADGEDLETIANRVESIMGDRIASSKEVIARTEVAASSNGATLLAWEQAERLIGPMVKHWLASLDQRTREDHLAAHDKYGDLKSGIPLDEDFEVGGARGPSPGQMGDPAQDCNCRCAMYADPAPF